MNSKRVLAKAGGGERRVEAQHNKGKLTVWERRDYPFDTDSFQESLSEIKCAERTRHKYSKSLQFF